MPGATGSETLYEMVRPPVTPADLEWPLEGMKSDAGQRALPLPLIAVSAAGLLVAGVGGWMLFGGTQQRPDMSRAESTPVAAAPVAAPRVEASPAQPRAAARAQAAQDPAAVKPPVKTAAAPVTDAPDRRAPANTAPTVKAVATLAPAGIPPAPTSATPPSAPSTGAAAAAAAAPVEPPAVRPLGRSPTPSQLQVQAEPQALDVRERYSTFLRLAQSDQLAAAGDVARQLVGTLGEGHVLSLRAMGYLAFKQRDLPAAKQHYQQLSSMLPEDREASLNLALVEWSSGDREAASRRAGALLEKFPTDPEIRALANGVRTP